MNNEEKVIAEQTEQTIKASDLSDSYDQFMLSTYDNPFNPFEDFDNWFQFDNDHDYCCCNRIARIVEESDDLTDKELNVLKEKAIDELIKNDFLDIFIKVSNKVVTADET